MGQPPPIPSPFLRLFSMLGFAVVAYGLQWIFGKQRDHRMALRHGMAAGFVLGGVDHFLNTEARYIPMLPDVFHPYGVQLVYASGIGELLGAIGLFVPTSIYRRLGLPWLPRVVGICVALMLTCLMAANVHVALKATHEQAFAFTAWLYWLRLLFQIALIFWALYASEIIIKPNTTMKVFLLDPRARLLDFLPDFKVRPLSYDSHTSLREKETSIAIPGGENIRDLREYQFDFLFSYDIFPKNILQAAGEWQQHGRTMQVGDVIVQQAYLPPLALSVKCVFAVKVLQIFREANKVGFSYGTLKGHAEMGVSEFYLSLQDGVLRATIHTHSYPGIFLTRLVAPVLTLPYQQYCSNQALLRIRDLTQAALKNR